MGPLDKDISNHLGTCGRGPRFYCNHPVITETQLLTGISVMTLRGDFCPYQTEQRNRRLVMLADGHITPGKRSC